MIQSTKKVEEKLLQNSLFIWSGLQKKRVLIKDFELKKEQKLEVAFI